MPDFPPGGSVVGDVVTNTTEGATVSFECEDGLIITPGSNRTVITCTYVNNNGVWMPDPASQQCMRSEGKVERDTWEDYCDSEDIMYNFFPRILLL